MVSIDKTLDSIFGVLSNRQKDVIVGRFGLDRSGEEKTLAAIGDKMGLTRERIRQIEQSAIGTLHEAVKKNAECGNILKAVKSQLQAAGGAMDTEELSLRLKKVFHGTGRNHLAFFSEASGEFLVYREDEDLRSFCYLSRESLGKTRDFIKGWMRHLEANKEKVLVGHYEDELKKFIKARGVARIVADNYLSLSRAIHKNSYGDPGLSGWPEIKPATARDKAYIVLRKSGKPLHFEAIAKEINNAKLGVQLALAPTVHNELIKDQRFVLVGRGMYALREQGFEPGVAKDVIKRILKQHGPMSAKDVIERVSKERVLKPNTIAINLQDKNHFERTGDGMYKVRES